MIEHNSELYYLMPDGLFAVQNAGCNINWVNKQGSFYRQYVDVFPYEDKLYCLVNENKESRIVPWITTVKS